MGAAPWHSPARQPLGSALLELGRPAQAESVFREDLERVPENGWSLYGLALALEAQERVDEASAVRTRFESAWARADIVLD